MRRVMWGVAPLLLCLSQADPSVNVPREPIRVEGSCDVLSLDSCSGQGEDSFCYLNLGNESTLCANQFTPAQQGDQCQFVNGCEGGLSCALMSPSGSELLCAHVCDPATGTIVQGGTCGDVAEIASGEPRCVRFDEFYSNVSLAVGMCVDCELYPDPVGCNRLFIDGFES